MGMTRDLSRTLEIPRVYFMKIFYAKMGKIKERNDLDLTEAEDTKKTWQKYTEKL